MQRRYLSTRGITTFLECAYGYIYGCVYGRTSHWQATRATGSVLTMGSMLALLLSGCTQTAQQSQTAAEQADVMACQETRPMVCTMEYRPVCATLADGSVKTYASGCNACADVTVTGHVPGVCEGD